MIFLLLLLITIWDLSNMLLFSQFFKKKKCLYKYSPIFYFSIFFFMFFFRKYFFDTCYFFDENRKSVSIVVLCFFFQKHIWTTFRVLYCFLETHVFRKLIGKLVILLYLFCFSIFEKQNTTTGVMFYI